MSLWLGVWMLAFAAMLVFTRRPSEDDLYFSLGCQAAFSAWVATGIWLING